MNSENTVSVKVLIDKQVYEKLKSDSQKYIELTTKNLNHLKIDKDKTLTTRCSLILSNMEKPLGIKECPPNGLSNFGCLL